MSVVSQAVRLFQGSQEGGLQFSIFDSNASHRKAQFRFRYPKIEQVAKLQFFEEENPFIDEAVFSKISHEIPISLIYMCNEDFEKDFSIETYSAIGSETKIIGFPAMETVCRFEAIVEETLDQLAMALHGFYCESGNRDSEVTLDSPNLADWKHLRGDYKESSRSQADHISLKIRTIGAEIADEEEDGRVHSFSHEEIDLLARLEHRRWWVEKILDGWKPGPYDFSRQFHPAMVPWESLSETDKKKNVRSITCLPEILSATGRRIISPFIF